jgi:hypothetical protein
MLKYGRRFTKYDLFFSEEGKNEAQKYDFVRRNERKEGEGVKRLED